MRRYELIKGICKAIGHKRKVPGQIIMTKAELRKVHIFLTRPGRAKKNGKKDSK